MDRQKELKAIERLKAFEPDDGYWLAYSGGKDSDCVKILAQLANVKFQAHHNLTTVDAPETEQYIKAQKDVSIDPARDKDGNQITMWRLIVQKGIPPTRIMRYCCSVLKEQGGRGRVVVTGVRTAESFKRKQSGGMVKIIGKPKATQKFAEKIGADYDITNMGGLIMNDDNDESRRMVEHCYRTTKTMVNPIIDWTDDDVWEFLKYYSCEGNPLYQCGFKRIGCIGCPMAGNRRRILEAYPKYKQLYINTFEKMLARYVELNRTTRWETGLDVYRWWIGEDFTQMTFDI